MFATVPLLVLARLCMAAIFAAAGVSKIGAPVRTRQALEQFGVPGRFTPLVAIILPVGELSVAAGLALRGTVHVAAAVALALLCVFTTAVSVSLMQGRRPQCACFGGIRAARIGAGTVVRNLVLASIAALLLLCAPGREFASADPSVARSPAADKVFAMGLGLGMAVTGWALLRRRRRRCGPSGSPKVRSRSLPIGASAPRFELPLLDGGVMTLEWLVRGGRAALLVFVSPECGQCAALLPAVAQLQEECGERLRVAVVISGNPEASRGMMGGSAVKISAADVKARIARRLRISAVPGAVLVAPSGAIASDTAAGARAVMNLMAQLAGGQLTNPARPREPARTLGGALYGS